MIDLVKPILDATIDPLIAVVAAGLVGLIVQGFRYLGVEIAEATARRWRRGSMPRSRRRSCPARLRRRIAPHQVRGRL